MVKWHELGRVQIDFISLRAKMLPKPSCNKLQKLTHDIFSCNLVLFMESDVNRESSDHKLAQKSKNNVKSHFH